MVWGGRAVKDFWWWWWGILAQCGRENIFQRPIWLSYGTKKKSRAIFFLRRVSVWTTADPVFKSLCLHPTPICRSSHTTDRIAGACTGAHLSSLRHCLRGRPTCSPEGRTHFFATRYVRWRHFIPPLMPILYSRTSEDGAGFHRQVFLPSFCYSVCEMVPHYSPKRDNNRFGEFSFSLCPVYGQFFYPGFPSCGRRAGSWTRDLRIRNPMLYHWAIPTAIIASFI